MACALPANAAASMISSASEQGHVELALSAQPCVFIPGIVTRYATESISCKHRAHACGIRGTVTAPCRNMFFDAPLQFLHVCQLHPFHARPVAAILRRCRAGHGLQGRSFSRQHGANDPPAAHERGERRAGAAKQARRRDSLAAEWFAATARAAQEKGLDCITTDVLSEIAEKRRAA